DSGPRFEIWSESLSGNSINLIGPENEHFNTRPCPS
ncbi:MAG: hypothetical protein ACJAVK_002571, partial [Akkermansiaceae bacterium]